MEVEDVLMNQSVHQLEVDLKSHFNVAVYARAMKHNAKIDAGNWGAAVAADEDGLVLGVDIEKDDSRASQLPTSVTLDDGSKLAVLYCRQEQPSIF